MFRHIKTPLVAALLASALLWPLSAFAGSSTIFLVRSTLSNDSDADGGGLWQYEGGTLQNAAGKTIGNYILERRVTTSGTETLNTASETISLFFPPSTSGNLPPGITVEGDYSYNTGEVDGAVSAAGTKYHWLIGADADGTVVSGSPSTKLILTWVGSGGLTVP